jgi:acetate kinase
MKILVLNGGSSSQKCRLFEIGRSIPAEPPTPFWEGTIDWGGKKSFAKLDVRNSRGATFTTPCKVGSHGPAVRAMLEQLWSGPAKAIEDRREIEIVGHRIVHGGSEFVEPTHITGRVIRKLRKLGELAPLHNRGEVEGINAVQQLLGKVPQIAVFDTAFHHQLPLPAVVYPGPYRWFEQGIRRYGFHGINHRYCGERAAQLLGKSPAKLRLISCHLGNGCSLAAIRGRHSVDTTMGFTPLDGLMMGTRPGSLDPGILTYLIRKHGYSAPALDVILNQKSGLLGISGISNDMREVLAAKRHGNARARLAFHIFIHRLRAQIGNMLASLAGLDALIFTAGIGENSAEVRTAACDAFEFLGMKLDSKRNLRSRPDTDVASAKSKIRVLVIRAQEDWAIARECWKWQRNRGTRPGKSAQGVESKSKTAR